MLKDKVKAELCRMEEMGIITKVGKPTEWVNPIVVVGKPNGDVCIYLDPVDLIKAVKREHFPLKRVEEVAASMSAVKVSQPLILRQDSIRSSWSKKVLGLLCSTHPFAILVWYQPQSFFKAPCLRCLRTVIVDDLLVWGKNTEDHGHTLKQVLKRAEENDFRFNEQKCMFHRQEVAYVGHILVIGTSTDSLRPSSDRIQAILTMPVPQDKTSPQRFMGMVN